MDVRVIFGELVSANLRSVPLMFAGSGYRPGRGILNEDETSSNRR
jgi:hypothetical protein